MTPPHKITKSYYLFPMFMAVVMFLMVRLTNDLPTHDNYFNHTGLFILSELISIMLLTYLGYFLTVKWVRVVLRNRIHPVVEYGVITVGILSATFLVVWLSHSVEHRPIRFNEVVPPGIIAVLVEVWIYLWLKTSEINRRYQESLLANERVRNEQLVTEMKLLQAQYHPHFLFNMLNTIYFSIHEDNADARNAVEHLSNLLRGQLYPGEGKVALARELSVLESYIELSRLRYGDKISVNVDISNYSYDAKIYPYMLLPLVENAFKHVGGAGLIEIHLRCDNQSLELHIRNTVDIHSVTPRPDGSGIGLTNLRRRLDIYYPEGGYMLDTGRYEGWFTAKLLLKI